MKTTRPLAGGVMAIALPSLTGCGDDPEPLSKPAFVTQADAIVDRAVDGDEAARERLGSEDGEPLADVDQAARDHGPTVCGAEE
jgi:hypothetical protein